VTIRRSEITGACRTVCVAKNRNRPGRLILRTGDIRSFNLCSAGGPWGFAEADDSAGTSKILGVTRTLHALIPYRLIGIFRTHLWRYGVKNYPSEVQITTIFQGISLDHCSSLRPSELITLFNQITLESGGVKDKEFERWTVTYRCIPSPRQCDRKESIYRLCCRFLLYNIVFQLPSSYPCPPRPSKRGYANTRNLFVYFTFVSWNTISWWIVRLIKSAKID
jgi:hypothetical protein